MSGNGNNDHKPVAGGHASAPQHLQDPPDPNSRTNTTDVDTEMSDNNEDDHFKRSCERYQASINLAARLRAMAEQITNESPRNMLIENTVDGTHALYILPDDSNLQRNSVQSAASRQLYSLLRATAGFQTVGRRGHGEPVTMPNDPGRLRSMADLEVKEAEQRWEADMEGRPSAQRQYRQQLRAIPPRITFQDFSTCGNCGGSDHTLMHCVWPSIDGYVHGCPWCNTTHHELPGCPSSGSLSTSSKMELISARACRPPLASYNSPWNDIMQLHMDHQEGRNKDVQMPINFPWSPEFAHYILDIKFRPWETVDYSKPEYEKDLPSDNTTRDLEAIFHHLGYLNYQPLPLHNAPRIDSGMSYEKMEEALDALVVEIQRNEGNE